MIGVALLLVGAAAAGGTAYAADTPSADSINREILAYQAAHPDDLVGLDALTMKYTGKGVEVKFSDSPEVFAAAAAEQHIASRRAKGTVDSRRAPSADGVAVRGISQDLFSVWVEKIPLYGPPSMMRITGRWDFKNSFAGQNSPYDIAALSFDMSSCVEMSGHSISTFSVTGKNTYRGSLRSANTAAHAPIWNVADGTKAFENLADRGGAGVTLTNRCKSGQRIGADFSYAFNSGGSIISVTAGYKALEVTYSGKPLELQKGSTPIYFTM